MKEIYAVDLDGTLCESYDWHDWVDRAPSHWMTIMENLKPKQNIIDYVNKIHDEGNEVFIFTARDDIYTKTTIRWLKKHGVKYDWIQMKKPFYTMFIEDRSIRPEEIK